MLPRRFRLPKELFGKVQYKKQIHSEFFLLRIGQKEGSQSRFSMVISKKTANLAVTRNAVRRTGYTAVESVMKDVKPGFVAVFTFKKGADVADKQVLAKEVVGALNKADLLVK